MQFLGKACPVCSRTFREDDDIVVCPKCGAPYHRECYQEKGKCIFPDLHQAGKSWHPAEESEKPTSDSPEGLLCTSCGTMNPPNAIVCKDCGNFLSKSASQNVRPPVEKEGEKSPEDNPDAFPFHTASPFSVFLDPMGGVPKDEDFDGVTAAELSKFVKTNTSYYIPLFARIKRQNSSKFNFCAFFFAGAWHLYRKQYLKGAVISIIYFLVKIATLMISVFYSAPLISEASDYFESENIRYASFQDYFAWGIMNHSFGEAILMFLPYILFLGLVIFKLICGFTANRGYYQFSMQKIRKFKAESKTATQSTDSESDEKPDEKSEAVSEKKTNGKTVRSLSEIGGVNSPVAWMFLACYLILRVASMFL